MSNEYAVEDIQRGLVEIVAANGSIKAAAEKTGISESTLRTWRDERYTERYREIKQRWEMRVEEEIVQHARDNALKAAQGTSEAIDLSLEALRNAYTKPAEKAQIALNLSKVMGTNVDKVLAMTGRSVDGGDGAKQGIELVKGLLSTGVLRLTNHVDGTATEIQGPPTGEPTPAGGQHTGE